MQKEYLNNKEIQALVGCGKNKACEIRKKAIIKYDGFNPNFPRLVRASAVRKVLEETLWQKNLQLGNGNYITS